MTTPLRHFFYIAIFQSFTIGACSAQASKNNAGTLQAPPANLVIDGNASEWGDSLRYYNAEKKINYSLANDKDNLYMAIRITDRLDQMKVLRAGIAFSIDTKGKKKESFSLTFPLNVGDVPQLPIQKDDNGDVTQDDRNELIRERITTLRGIKVTGFKDIEDDMITTANTYGIKAAINYDDKGSLIYEVAIPLSFFHVDDIAKNEWAFNFKINGVTRPAVKHDAEAGQDGGGFGGGGRGGRSGGGGRRGREGNRTGGAGSEAQSELAKSVDFWEKFHLAK